MDVTELLSKINETLVSLEEKVDTLINRAPIQTRERRFDHGPRHHQGRQDGGFRERNFYKVICADCNKECEVPFKPGQGRPVYCKECFSKRRNSGVMFKEKSYDVSVMRKENKKSSGKKRTTSRKPRKR